MNGDDRHILLPAHAADSGSDRFEFRTFFRSRPPPAVNVLESLAGAGRSEASRDRYVVIPNHVDASLKLRSGRIELKTLTRTLGSLERWHPEAEVSLPARGETLASLLVPLELPSPGHDHLFADTSALAEWFTHAKGIPVITVCKRRHRLFLPDARAELGRIIVGNRALRTLAVEAVDPDTVRDLVARLDLTGAKNTSYPRLLSGGFSA
jgi:hypothetical protein